MLIMDSDVTSMDALLASVSENVSCEKFRKFFLYENGREIPPAEIVALLRDIYDKDPSVFKEAALDMAEWVEPEGKPRPVALALFSIPRYHAANAVLFYKDGDTPNIVLSKNRNAGTPWMQARRGMYNALMAEAEKDTRFTRQDASMGMAILDIIASTLTGKERRSESGGIPVTVNTRDLLEPLREEGRKAGRVSWHYGRVLRGAELLHRRAYIYDETGGKFRVLVLQRSPSGYSDANQDMRFIVFPPRDAHAAVQKPAREIAALGSGTHVRTRMLEAVRCWADQYTASGMQPKWLMRDGKRVRNHKGESLLKSKFIADLETLMEWGGLDWDTAWHRKEAREAMQYIHDKKFFYVEFVRRGGYRNKNYWWKIWSSEEGVNKETRKTKQ